MTVIGDYDHECFDTLPTFEVAQANLRWAQENIESCAAVIARHGADARVGIGLLHRHFELDSHERLVEIVSPTDRVSTGAPRPVSEAISAAPHLFRAMRAGDAYMWRPLEFADPASGPTDAQENVVWLREHRALLDELAAELDAAGTLDVFGLSVNHGREEIECAEDEVLVESTDARRRMLRMEPRRLDEIGGTTTPTNWDAVNGAVRMRCTCQRDQSGSHQHFETN